MADGVSYPLVQKKVLSETDSRAKSGSGTQSFNPRSRSGMSVRICISGSSAGSYGALLPGSPAPLASDSGSIAPLCDWLVSLGRQVAAQALTAGVIDGGLLWISCPAMMLHSSDQAEAL